MFKKTMLLAVSACAAMALVAPVMAQAAWGPIAVEEESQPIGTKHVSFRMEGNLTESNWGYSNLELGPCNYRMTGSVWNAQIEEEPIAEAEIANIEVDTPCPVKYKGITVCTVSGASSGVSAENPIPMWEPGYVGLIYGSNVSLGSASHTFTIYRSFNEGCSMGPGNLSTGTITSGVWQNGNGQGKTATLTFENASGMIDAAGEPTQISGQLHVVYPSDLALK